MTSPTTEKQWWITATIDTALCIGDSGASETGADKSTVKTSDGKLYIPASTLKGIWRHACEAIARSKPHFVCNSPRAENMCPRPKEELEKENTKAMQDNHCIICQIFGSPSSESRIFISDLTLDDDLGTETTAIRSGVTINRNRKVAEDQRLYFTETSRPNAGFEFSGNVTIGSDITAEQIDLLTAGLKYIHTIGSGKTRGLGWLSIAKEDITPETQRIETEASVGAISESRPTPEDYTELSLQVTLESPILTGGRKPSGQAVEAVNYIRGALIRGAIAKALLADLENNEPDDDFRQLFLNDEAGIFRNCTPGAMVLPATAASCKDFSGFRKADDNEKHGMFDTLLERIVSEKAKWMYQPNCPKCQGRVEAQGGFYTKSDNIFTKKELNTRLLTRVAINRQRKVAEDELLYHLTAIDPIIVRNKKETSQDEVESEKVILHGSARIPSDLVNKVDRTLQQKVKRLGGGSSRGLGKVCIAVDKQQSFDTLSKRIDAFNEALQEVWQSYADLPNTEMGQFEGTYFSVNLQSDAILTAEDEWQRSMTLNASMLKDMTGCKTDLTLVRSFASHDYVGGWNAAWELPKETDLVTKIGSVFVFHTSDLDAWLSELQTLENIGIGNRREEGFGQVLICDRFHLQMRDKIKSENKEASE